MLELAPNASCQISYKMPSISISHQLPQSSTRLAKVKLGMSSHLIGCRFFGLGRQDDKFFGPPKREIVFVIKFCGTFSSEQLRAASEDCLNELIITLQDPDLSNS